jgi:hypothetical protein
MGCECAVGHWYSRSGLLGKKRGLMAVPGTNFFFGLRERTLVRGCIRGVKALPQTVRETIRSGFSGFANERLIVKDGQIFMS